MAPATGWRFNAIAETFWNDLKVRSWDEDTRALALYLLTCPNRTGEGFYHLPLPVARDDLGWTRERLQAALERLSADDFAEYDEAPRLVLIVKALKHHPRIKGAPAIKGALNVLDKANGSERLFARFLEAADKYQPDLGSAIRGHYGISQAP